MTISASSPNSDSCCVVGGGPAGAMLALLLARRGVSVTLLERQADFERDYRGDTLPPGVLEVLDQLGLADATLDLATSRLSSLALHYPGGSLNVADLRKLPTRFPFVALTPQARFLELLVSAAGSYSSFRLLRGAEVQELIEREGVVRGVRYQDSTGAVHELRATLTVATDGRGSKLRRLAGMTSVRSASEIDLLWFRVPRRREQLDDRFGGVYLAAGGYLIALERDRQWQVGFVIRKGTLGEWRDGGVERLREAFRRVAPDLAASADDLTDWKQVRPLSVQSDRLLRWHRPGLLFLGDAAHVMSPVGGVGIQCAIQDAVVAANRLAGRLLAGHVTDAALDEVQRRRAWAVKLVQRMQAFDQTHLIDAALRTTGAYRLPWWLRTMVRIPGVRNWPSHIFAFGPSRVRVDEL